MKLRTLLPIALYCTVLVAACGGEAGTGDASCEKVGVHFVLLATAEVDKLPDDHAEKKAALANLPLLPKLKADMIKECKSEKWSAEVRTCFVGSANVTEFNQKCAELTKRLNKNGPAKEPAAAKPSAGTPPEIDPKAIKPTDGEAPKGDGAKDDTTVDKTE